MQDEELLNQVLSSSLEVIEEAAEQGVPVYARRLARTSIIVEGPLGKAVAKPAILKPVKDGENPGFGLIDVKTKEAIPFGILDKATGRVLEVWLENVATLMSILGILPWQRADVWRYRLENRHRLEKLVEDECCIVLGLAGRKCLAIHHKGLGGIVAWYNGDIGVFEVTGGWLVKWRRIDEDIEDKVMDWINNTLPRLVNA